MRTFLDKLCVKRLETKTNGHLATKESKKRRSDPQLWRDILAYWILGLACEFGYVVVISAAHDILHGFGSSSNVIVKSNVMQCDFLVILFLVILFAEIISHFSA